MSKFKQQDEKKEAYEFPTYTKQELKDLNQLIEEKYNGGNKVDDITQWLKDEGALGKDGGVIITGYNLKKNRVGELYPSCDYPSKYLLLQDKLEKANMLFGKKKWAEKKDLETLEKTVQGMKIYSYGKRVTK